MDSKQKTFTYKTPERFDTNLPRDVTAMLQDLPYSEWDCVTLDLSGTMSMDSSGIGLLVYLYKELSARSKVFVIKRPQRGVYNLLLETGIDRLFDIEMSSGVIKAEANLGDIDPKLNITDETIGDTCVLSLSGVMNYPAGSDLFKKHMFLALAVSNKVLLDMDDLAFFDSLSVGSVLRLSRLLRDNKGSMKICRANEIVRNVFDSLGVDQLIPIYDSREAALADKDF